MRRPTRRNAAGQAYLDLQNQARREGRQTHDVLVMYALERFLARMAAGRHADRFVLKGGMLLAALNARRPTADADFLATALDGDQDEILAVIRDITASRPPEEDGVEFEGDTAAVRAIRETEVYAGSRVTLMARVDRARSKVGFDVDFGDPVTPGPVLIDYPRLRESLKPFRLLAYPLPTVLAEKLVTSLTREDTNTRLRDYIDVWTLIRRHDVDAGEVAGVLWATAHHREVPLTSLSQASAGLLARSSSGYESYRTSLGLDGAHLPTDFAHLLAQVVAFADPVLNGDVETGVWRCTELRWDVR